MDVPATHRLHHAWHRRADSDDRFDFWTALGWTLRSFGLSSYDIASQRCRRMRDHDIRRLQLLEAANEPAWQRAVDAGRVVALFASCGLYAHWWLFDLMDEGNRHFARDWGWEDAFVPAAVGVAA